MECMVVQRRIMKWESKLTNITVKNLYTKSNIPEWYTVGGLEDILRGSFIESWGIGIVQDENIIHELYFIIKLKTCGMI